MPWKEITTMQLREEFVKLAQADGSNISLLCKRYSISRKTGYIWIERFKNKQPWEDKSRRPHHSPRITDKAIEEKIIEVRLQHQTWGGRKIKKFLENKKETDIPAPSVISKVLRRNGLIRDQHKEVIAWKRFEREAPNHL